MTTLHSIAELSAARLLNSIVEGLLVALLAWILLRVVGRRNSGTRFAIWFSALVMIAALPLIEFRSSAAAPTGRPEIALASSWAVYLFGAWALIAAAAVARIAVGLWRVRQLRSSCVPVKVVAVNSAVPSAARGKTALLERRVLICTSDQVPVPTAIGFFRPTVVIPNWAMNELSSEELNAVILHEVAHLRRWDDWSNLAQKTIRALFFFHPAVWWIDNRLSLEREMACDDLVLADTANPRGYAECLVSLAEKNFLRRSLTMAQAAVGRIRHMSARVARILQHPGAGARPGWKPATAVVAILCAAGLVPISRMSPLVGFENPPSPPRLSSASGSVRLPAAMVVPARLTAERARSVSAVKTVAAVAKQQRRPEVFNNRSAVVIPARAKNVQPVRPAVVQAKAQQPGAMQSSYVVVQTEYYANNQGTVWTMTVWQVQAGSPQHKQVIVGIIPRSI
jgi:beta-lactamase regulating signal transducer with metallopeptidase domain